MVVLIGPPAMIRCEPRQARKGATVAVSSCAGMWLVRAPPFLDLSRLFCFTRAIIAPFFALLSNAVSYQVLARKWRPRIFREMVGQEHVLKALINALDNQRLHHAYLFAGTRGVGKTTIARILAKCLNCEVGVSSEPCGTCSACREIAEGRFVDLLEVDAASRTKVEDTRELLDNVQYLPSRGRYKIYLIDEVHMLSNSSFNALLKTLEEPPEHVKFLLATTDPHKLPVTVLSRCLQFNLKNMSPERIVGHLRFVLGEEAVPCEEAALWQLARAADGSMRDALSLTDQAIAFGNGQVNGGEVAAMLGTIDYQLIAQLMEALIESNGKALLDAVGIFAEQAPDFFGALGDLTSLLHRVAITQALPDALDNSFGDREQILDFSRRLAPEDVQLFYQTALMGRRDLHLSPDPRAGFEMCLLRMLAFKPQGLVDVPQDVLAVSPPLSANTAAPPITATAAAEIAEASQITQPPEASAEPSAPAEPQEASDNGKKSLAEAIGAELMAGLTTAAQLQAPAKLKTPPPEPQPAVVPKGNKITLEEFRAEHWVAVYQALNVRGVLQSTAANAVLVGREGSQLFFVLDAERGSLFEDSHRQRLSDLLSDYFGQPLRVHIALQTLDKDAQTPAAVAIKHRAQQLQAAIETLEADPLVAQLRQQLDGRLDVESVKIIERGAQS